MFLVAHLCGCGFHYVGIHTDPERNWITHLELTSASTLEQYICSIYFATISMITVGYGDVIPINMYERTYVIVMACVGCGIFALAINTIGNIVKEKQTNHLELKLKKTSVLSYMKERNISKNNMNQVIRYLDYQHRNQNDQQQKSRELMAGLSKRIRTDVYSEFYSRVLNSIPLLSYGFSPEFKLELQSHLTEGLFAPGESIISQNQLNQNIYFIVSGEVLQLIEKSASSTLPPTVIAHLKSGDSFDEESFLSQKGSKYDYVCKQMTQVVMLNRNTVQSIIKNFKLDHETFSQKSHESMFSSRFHASKEEVTCLSCNLKTHDLLRCPLLHYEVNHDLLVKRFMSSKSQIRDETHKRILEKHKIDFRILRKQSRNFRLLLPKEYEFQPPNSSDSVGRVQVFEAECKCLLLLIIFLPHRTIQKMFDLGQLLECDDFAFMSITPKIQLNGQTNEIEMYEFDDEEEIEFENNEIEEEIIKSQLDPIDDQQQLQQQQQHQSIQQTHLRRKGFHNLSDHIEQFQISHQQQQLNQLQESVQPSNNLIENSFSSSDSSLQSSNSSPDNIKFEYPKLPIESINNLGSFDLLPITEPDKLNFNHNHFHPETTNVVHHGNHCQQSLTLLDMSHGLSLSNVAIQQQPTQFEQKIKLTPCISQSNFPYSSFSNSSISKSPSYDSPLKLRQQLQEQSIKKETNKQFNPNNTTYNNNNNDDHLNNQNPHFDHRIQDGVQPLSQEEKVNIPETKMKSSTTETNKLQKRSTSLSQNLLEHPSVNNNVPTARPERTQSIRKNHTLPPNQQPSQAISSDKYKQHLNPSNKKYTQPSQQQQSFTNIGGIQASSSHNHSFGTATRTPQISLNINQIQSQQINTHNQPFNTYNPHSSHYNPSGISMTNLSNISQTVTTQHGQNFRQPRTLLTPTSSEISKQLATILPQNLRQSSTSGARILSMIKSLLANQRFAGSKDTVSSFEKRQNVSSNLNSFPQQTKTSSAKVDNDQHQQQMQHRRQQLPHELKQIMGEFDEFTGYSVNGAGGGNIGRDYEQHRYNQGPFFIGFESLKSFTCFFPQSNYEIVLNQLKTKNKMTKLAPNRRPGKRKNNNNNNPRMKSFLKTYKHQTSSPFNRAAHPTTNHSSKFSKEIQQVE